MRNIPPKARLVAFGASLLILAGVPAAAQASKPAMKHHPAMKKHHAMMHHPGMKHSKK
jgi:hypothetical protein